MTMTVDDFEQLLQPLTRMIGGRPLDQALATYLNTTLPPGSTTFEAIRQGCLAGVAGGWMCQREAGGIRYGRVIKPSPAVQGFSVDVVRMHDIKGPHHVHPNGEIDMVMPLTAGARFDGQGAGWKVYGPGSAHQPTVTGGEALVLYLLPEGAIEFTKA